MIAKPKQLNEAAAGSGMTQSSGIMLFPTACTYVNQDNRTAVGNDMTRSSRFVMFTTATNILDVSF